MMISGQKAAHLALRSLGQANAVDGTNVGSVHPELVLAAADEAETLDAWREKTYNVCSSIYIGEEIRINLAIVMLEAVF